MPFAIGLGLPLERNNQGSESVLHPVPSWALLDQNGDPILDQNGNFIPKQGE